VKEEEKPGGMIAEAKKSKMDLSAVGEQLLARKQELQSQSKPLEEAGPWLQDERVQAAR
jgi:hypothetical protein